MAKNNIPVYVQIQDDVIKKIDNNEWSEGMLIPTEKELATLWQVNRLTIRSAFDILEQRGYITRIKGKGTFIKRQEFVNQQVLNVSKIRETHQKLIQSHGKMEIKVIKFESMPIPSNIATILTLPDDREVIYIERVRYFGNTPAVYEQSYMLRDIVPNISIDDLSVSKHDYIEKLGYTIAYSDRQLKGVIPSTEIKEKLNLSRFSIVMQMTSHTYIKDNIPLEVVYGFYNQDIYSFVAHSKRT